MVDHPVTWPIGKVLERLTGGRTLKGALAFHIGARHAPAVRVHIPVALTKGGDRASYIRNQVAAEMRLPVERTIVASPHGFGSVHAGLSLDLYMMLAEWSKQAGVRMVQLRPLWSIASDCHMVRRPNIESARIREPGYVTMLNQMSDLEGLMSTADEDSGLPVDLTVQFNTAKTQTGVVPGGPRAWTGHWSLI